MKSTAFSRFSFIVLLLSISFTCFAVAQEVDDELEFNYEGDSEIGPSNWGNIRPEWKKCNVGNMQSPIDLTNQRVRIVSHLGKLNRNYKPSNATILNRGHDIMLRFVDNAGHIEINGTKYHLRQCHWHAPSEHTISGKSFDMEAHLVHQSEDNKTAVVGIMYKIGRPDPFLSMIRGYLQALVDTREVEKTIGMINPGNIKFGSRKYYRYIGSLTVPPCTENVTWTMVKKVRTVSRNQVHLMRDAVHDAGHANARPVQSPNGRKVELYRPNDNGNEK